MGGRIVYLVAGLCAGLVLGSAAIGYAASQRQVAVHNGDAVVFREAGISCVARSLAFICARVDGKGYAIGYGPDVVIVTNPNDKIVLVRKQPMP